MSVLALCPIHPSLAARLDDAVRQQYAILHAGFVEASGPGVGRRPPKDLDQYRDEWVTGTPAEIVAKIRAWECAGTTIRGVSYPERRARGCEWFLALRAAIQERADVPVRMLAWTP